MLEKLATLDKLHDKVDSICLLEDVVHSYDERMVYLVQDEFLYLQRLDGLMLDYYVLANDFHRKVLVLLFVSYEINFAEGATTDDADKLKVIPTHFSDSSSSI